MIFLLLNALTNKRVYSCFLFSCLTFSCIAIEPIIPIVKNPSIDTKKFNLGELLFKDHRLSGNQNTSCYSCHNLTLGGDDGLKTSVNLLTNSPTVFNVSKNYYLGWLGKYNQLKPHLEMILNNPKVMNIDWNFTINVLAKDVAYSKMFQAIYKTGVSKANIINALLYYEENLILPSKFDAFLLGDTNAISASAKKGYEKFKDYGCASCHQGANVGGNVFQKLGVIHKFSGENGNYVTKKLRVPSLRNVAVTSPYLHDGSVTSLKWVIKIMAKYQLGQTLTDTEVDQIHDFLKTLTSITE
ncbi:cytochrome c peroxidase [Colwellia sp. UCD-KL20]|uniref:cytochrome-c peroxidase n=1 Tax=Colwellia sp. UCD-KL20 TaxID=1917165 RepID=UPI0015C3E5B5|nr:cytochrome c peroxidase [Colwellia sp. UCD-KL20]